MKVVAQVAPIVDEFAQGASAASLPLPRASVTSVWAASSSALAKMGSIRCASFRVKLPVYRPAWRESGGKFLLGVSEVPSSACTDASYSASVSRRMLAGNSTGPPETPAVPVVAPRRCPRRRCRSPRRSRCRLAGDAARVSCAAACAPPVPLPATPLAPLPLCPALPLPAPLPVLAPTPL